MSEFIPPSLDQSWQSSGLRRTLSVTSNASDVSNGSNASNASNGSKILTDDDLESLSLSETPSESDLGEDPWNDPEGNHHHDEDANSDPDMRSRSRSATADSDSRLPQHLGRDDDDDPDDEDAEPSSEQGSDSTFSFSFPDPLNTTAEYVAHSREPTIDISDIPAIPHVPEVQDSLADFKEGSEDIGIVEEIVITTLFTPESSVSEKPITVPPIPPQPRVATSSRTSLFYATSIVVSAILVGYLSHSFYYESGITSIIRPDNSPSGVSGGWIPSLFGSKESNVRTDAGIPLQTIQTTPKVSVPSGNGHVKSALPNSADSSASQKGQPNAPSRQMVPVNSISFTPSSSSVVTLTPTPLKTPNLTSDFDSNPIPFSKFTTALTTKLWDFSNVILHDLQDVLDIITEILRFIRADVVAETVQQQSRSTIDYIVSKIGERHERAKSNARKLWKALTDFTDPDIILNDPQSS